MSWFEQVTVEAAKVQSLEDLETTEARDKLVQHVPQPFTLKGLADSSRGPFDLASSAKSWEVRMARTQLLSVLTCLRCKGRITPEPSTDHEAVKELALNITKLIAPVVTQDQSEVSNQDLLKNSQALVEQCQANSGLGIAALEALMKQTTTAVRLEDEVLYTLVAYTEKPQTGGGRETEAIANPLLEQQFSIPDSSTKEQFLTETVLQTYLRPLFSKSKPASITTSGRKAEYTDSAPSKAESMPDESAVTKPWKYTDMRATPAVAWAVREADNQLIAKHWPLFIPVLLTLADDATTPIRRRGLLILADFLAKFPDKTLHGTGLAQVFEDAIFPTLSYLPSLTPEEESVELLVPAYDALLILAKKQPAVGKDGIAGAPKNGFLDRMLREGVLGGYFHAKDHVRIVEVLCQQTVAILDEMGVHAVKHLKDLVPMLSTIMTDPFAPVAPGTLFSAIKALQAVLTNCWPRIPHSPWQDEIINALVLSWLHLAEHSHAATDKTYARLQQELVTSSRALAAVLKTAGDGTAGAVDLSLHVAPLVEKDPRLAALFPSN